jgi:hypothetical protein
MGLIDYSLLKPLSTKLATSADVEVFPREVKKPNTIDIIFSSKSREVKSSRKHAELAATRGSYLGKFLSCTAGMSIAFPKYTSPFNHIDPPRW